MGGTYLTGCIGLGNHRRFRGKRWRREEDVSLAAAYAAVASAGVKEGPSFWDAVRNQVQSSRSVRALRNRWVYMNQEVRAFVQCLERIEAPGACDLDGVVNKAMIDFRESKFRDFEFFSCWEIVKKCHEIRTGEGGGQVEETQEDEKIGALSAQRTAETVEAIEQEDQNIQAAGVVPASEVNTVAPLQEKVETKTKTPGSPKKTAIVAQDLAIMQQQLVSEMRRKNDLQEDELAFKLFSERRESDESQQFFKLLKRKKLLLLKIEVEELEQGQQRQRQRRE
ncbi:hypothetical protein PsorP6_007653 [Peronosclerospora sorghi]|uniref:Uncharacterized protein n=1 Tax=Peronosclerospora sorghi TaxID=230839 RepID=A0ACC0WA84_9STRA|nr:hypothetical protein PsorP6_007653 [Peronosclerospora sorghi]